MLARVSCSTGTRDLNKGNGEGNSRPVGEQDRVRGLESLEEYWFASGLVMFYEKFKGEWVKSLDSLFAFSR